MVKQRGPSSFVVTAVTAARAQPWLLCVVALVGLTGLSPRIPLEVVVPGRTFDLRVADLVLLGAVPIWLVSWRLRILDLPLGRRVAVYLGIACVTTLIAVATLGLNWLRGGLYVGKEVEYLGLGLMVSAIARTTAQRRSILVALLTVGTLNALWFAFQIAIQQDVSLLTAERPLPADVFVEPNRLVSYGPHLIGEASPFAAGGFFMIVFLLAATWLGNGRTRIGIFLALMGAAFIACVALSQSRVSLAGALIGVVVLMAVTAPPERLRTAAVLFSLVIAGLGMSTLGAERHVPLEAVPSPTPQISLTPSPGATSSSGETQGPNSNSGGAQPPSSVLAVGVARRLGLAGVLDSVNQRVDTVWAPLFKKAAERPLVGYGKGALGALPGLDASEAHMAYLRVLVESGVIGLVAFLSILAGAAGGARVLVQRGMWESAMLGRLALATTAAMAVAALVQDAFTPVILNQTYWIVMGTALSALVRRDSA